MTHRQGPVVTIDGPAGSGKSSTAREVATRLGFRHLDSGAMYRAITLALLKAKVPEGDWASLDEAYMRGLDVEVVPHGSFFDVFVNGEMVDGELRTEEVTARVARLASLPAARACLLSLQRAAGAHGSLVADGRDMGSVVFPEADVKVYLVADLEERARRRLREGGGGEPTDDEVHEHSGVIAARDRHDSEREISPLRKPEDAHLIDTTRLDFAAQVGAIVQLVEQLTLT